MIGGFCQQRIITKEVRHVVTNITVITANPATNKDLLLVDQETEVPSVKLSLFLGTRLNTNVTSLKVMNLVLGFPKKISVNLVKFVIKMETTFQHFSLMVQRVP